MAHPLCWLSILKTLHIHYYTEIELVSELGSSDQKLDIILVLH